MAYKNSYDDLLRDIQSNGQKWSAADLALAKENPDAGRSIYTQKEGCSAATTDEERLAYNQAANMVREKYGGYSGGKNGGGFTLSDKYAPATPDYVKQNEKYSAQIDKLFGELKNRGAFTYNPSSDPSYQAYSEKYRNLGRKSAADALGSAAAMTGGQLNSYALTAAQQAQDSYNSQMSDVIPELQQLAYNMHMDELGQKRADLSALMQRQQADHGMSRDTFLDSVTNWQLNQGAGQQAIENERYEDELAYKKEQDALGWAYQKDGNAYTRALQKWQLTGVLDEAGAKVLGIPAGTKTTDYQYQLAQMAKMTTTSRSGDSGGGGGEPDYEGLYTAAQKSGNPDNYIATNYKKYGFTKLTGLTGGYKDWVKGQDVGGQVTNQAGSSWIQVSGFGRLTWAELEGKVSSGEILETKDSEGKYTYKKNTNYKK